MKNYLKRMGISRFIIMFVGNVILGLGVAMLLLSQLGMDPFDGMNYGIAQHVPITYAQVQLLVNILLFVIEILLSRKRIGVGTIVNAVGLGYFVTFFDWLLSPYITADTAVGIRVCVLFAGLLIASFGLSLYQTPNVGVSPYDCLPMILNDRLKIPYFAGRVICDATCALICYAAKGPLGVGSVLMAFCLGPFITFFDKVFTSKIVTPME